MKEKDSLALFSWIISAIQILESKSIHILFCLPFFLLILKRHSSNHLDVRCGNGQSPLQKTTQSLSCGLVNCGSAIKRSVSNRMILFLLSKK